MVSKVQGNGDRLETPVKFPGVTSLPSPPLKSKKVAVSATAEDKKENQGTTAAAMPTFAESSPYCRHFRATAADVDPILRTVLPLAPGIGRRVYKVTMDDILIHFMGLKQAENEDLFVGYMQGRRVVVTRMSPDDFGLFCADETQVKAFLLALRSYNVQVQDITRM